jgi:hypothetical protein
LTPELIANQISQTFKTHCDGIQSWKKPAIEAEEENEQCHEVSRADDNQISTLSRYTVKLNKIYTPSKLGRFAMTYTTATGAWQAYVQWPSWISTSVYELQSSPTLGGWSYNYRVYNIISSESDIIKKIEKGDKAGVLELFKTRKASPFDKDSQGHSLLYVSQTPVIAPVGTFSKLSQYAANKKHFDLCQLFLSLGLQNALIDRVGTMNE